MSEITWPEIVKIASDGLANREPFDVAQADLMARGIVAMNEELFAITAPHLLRATRLYTDELAALRKRVADLEALIAGNSAGNSSAGSYGTNG
jgi:hypothetical protein